MGSASVKPVILMAITLFLISAPAPDAGDIAELTANFIVPESYPEFQAEKETSYLKAPGPGTSGETAAAVASRKGTRIQTGPQPAKVNG